MIDGKTILVTGGTGSFGTAFLRRILECGVQSVRVLSRDELKQAELAAKVSDDRVRFLLGDVRDLDRLIHATRGVDLVVHAAALKRVEAAEYNPTEVVATNVDGAINVVNATIANNVPRTIGLSSDKAVAPNTLYGASKLCAERIFIAANNYASNQRFSIVRYGNVEASRGSVIPLFRKQAEQGELTITDEAMTRFFISQERMVEFVLETAERMQGGEVFIPRMSAKRIVDLAEEIAPGVPHRIVGIRPGEKVHEVLIGEDEARYTREFEDHFSIRPSIRYWDADYPPGRELAPGFRYSSEDAARPSAAVHG